MAYIKDQINTLSKICDDYSAKKNKTKKDMEAFVNDAYNQINIINKLIAITAAGVNVEVSVNVNNKDEKPKVNEEEKISKNENIETEKAKDAPKKEEPKEEAAPAEEEDNSVYFYKDHPKEEKLEEMDVEEFLNGSDEFDEYENASAEEIIKQEIESWGVNTKYAGAKNLINLGKAYEASNGTLNQKSKINEFIEAISIANNISESQAAKNIDFIINKADFTKSKFIPIFRRTKKQLTAEIILRELIEFISGE